jgi:hypothetical protein
MSINIFQQIERPTIDRSRFDIGFTKKFSGRFGELLPCYLEEVIPGDVITGNVAGAIRLAPTIAPVMHELNCYVHYFFVPNRIIWPNWEDFITGGEDGAATPVFPTSSVTVSTGTLWDYLGLPVVAAYNQTVNSIPAWGYTKIYNEYYRDQNLITAIDDEVNDGNNPPGAQIIRRRAWEHDYFTSCLPFTQKGDNASIPAVTIDWTYLTQSIVETTTPSSTGNHTFEFQGDGVTTTANTTSNHGGSYESVRLENLDTVTATGAAINDLRRAFAVQRFLEINARAGSRYTEFIKAHFNVNSQDMRLQRPEFLGGGKIAIQISEVLQTSESTAGNPLGELAGHGVGAGQGSQWTCDVKEHGFIMGIFSARPKSGYYQGRNRFFDKFDKFDYFLPEFENIGEQPVYNKEVYVANDGDDDKIFGYNPRYSEYKHRNNEVAGAFRNTLNFWQWDREFTTRPNLNQAFIECTPDQRIFAVQNNAEEFYVSLYHNVQRSAPMQYFGSPGMERL